jgi:MSHA biogenesis protein MshP
VRIRTRIEGFTLISAIFILVVVALAGAFMLSVSGVERQTSNLGLLGPLAYHAARSGLEWGMHEAAATPAVCPTGTFSLSEGGLSGFNVTVTCSKTDHVENSATTTVFRITSEASRGTYGDSEYVARMLEAGAMVGP